MADKKPILCLDFDGVLHSYTSGWKGADVIPDPPVPGAMRFILDAAEHFQIAIFSSRSNQPGGRVAMQIWLGIAMSEITDDPYRYLDFVRNRQVYFPTEKPPAMVTIDDRAITFTGEWPEIETLLAFKPWNKS